MHTDADGAVTAAAVEYFMIRVHPDRSAEPPRISGVIERLGTGEKLTFADTTELIGLLGSWPKPASKMQVAPGPGNQEVRAS
jgi:hypothetical protein